MRTLRLNTPMMRGDDVRQWQSFLFSKGYTRVGTPDGDFGNNSHNTTIQFQRNHNLEPDGIVGPRTQQKAAQFGFRIPPGGAPSPGGGGTSPGGGGTTPGGGGTTPGSSSPNAGSTTWPPVPAGLPRPSLSLSRRIFGTFSYVFDNSHDPDGIRITDGWDRENIVSVNIPQLVGVDVYGTPSRGNMRVNRRIVSQLRNLFAAWERAGLTSRILTFGGAFMPRYIRGSRTSLSNHAFGSAFDINMAQNGLGRTPAAVGARGSVRELVPIANDHGFFWGGHYNSRKDGMHFEVVDLI